MLYETITPFGEIVNEDPSRPTPAPAPLSPSTLSVFDIPPTATPLVKVYHDFNRSRSDTLPSATATREDREEHDLRALNTPDPTPPRYDNDETNNVDGEKNFFLQVSEQMWFQQDGRIGIVPRSAVTWASQDPLGQSPHSPFSWLDAATPPGDTDEPTIKPLDSYIVGVIKGEQSNLEQGTTVILTGTHLEQSQGEALSLSHEDMMRQPVVMRLEYAQQSRTAVCLTCDFTLSLARTVRDKAKEVHDLVKQLEEKSSRGESSSIRCNPRPSLVRRVAQKAQYLRCRVGQLGKRVSGQHWHYSSSPPTMAGKFNLQHKKVGVAVIPTVRRSTAGSPPSPTRFSLNSSDSSGSQTCPGQNPTPQAE